MSKSNTFKSCSIRCNCLKKNHPQNLNGDLEFQSNFVFQYSYALFPESIVITFSGDIPNNTANKSCVRQKMHHQALFLL